MARTRLLWQAGVMVAATSADAEDRRLNGPVCEDTPGWTDSEGQTCDAYAKSSCRNGLHVSIALADLARSSARPELNCCACGKKPPPAVSACGGTGEEGSVCMFPFIYKGKNYTGCTKDGRDKLWCMVDNHGSWGYCQCNENLYHLSRAGAVKCVGKRITSERDCEIAALTLGYQLGRSLRDFNSPGGCQLFDNEVRWNTNMNSGAQKHDVQLVCPGVANLCSSIADSVITIRDVCPDDLYMQPLSQKCRQQVDPEKVLVRNAKGDTLLLTRIKQHINDTKETRMAALAKAREEKALREHAAENTPIVDEWETGYEQLKRLADMQVTDVLSFQETWANSDTELLGVLDPHDGAFARGKLTTEAMRQHLPRLSDLRDWVARQPSLAIVGSGQILRNTTLGPDIDAHDEVVRFNDLLPNRVSMNATETGHKTTVHVMCAKVAAMKSAKVTEFDLEWNTPWLSWCRRMHWGGQFFSEAPAHLVRPTALCCLGEAVKQFTRGFLFYWFVGRLFNSVDLYGFAGSKHYQNDHDVFEDFLSFEHMVYRIADGMKEELRQSRDAKATTDPAEAARQMLVHVILTVTMVAFALACVIGGALRLKMAGKWTEVERGGKPDSESTSVVRRIVQAVQTVAAGDSAARVSSRSFAVVDNDQDDSLTALPSEAEAAGDGCRTILSTAASLAQLLTPRTAERRTLLRTASGISC
eukprot:TRINITY_DN92823_c0_g1_i1.p1 TRINITY_DN92823_c0_g1~~TRINITY_DN92823_c0_g1_i1.p1  ORF type:complete len:700 (+),score=91.70 TRINITY_DN92823_c0_g1_i1:114-2213(+)